MVPKCLKKGPRLGMAILDTRNSLDLQGGSGKIKMRLFFLKKRGLHFDAFHNNIVNN